MLIMGLTTSHPALRWAVPGAVAAVVLAASGLTAVLANATPTLPARSAAELLVDVQTANVAALSGTVVQTADLGLPELPVQMGGRGSADFTSLVSGSHTLRVWYSGPDQQRLALLGTMGESDIVRNGTDVWTWSSADNAATHYQLPEPIDGETGEVLPDSALPGPSAADSALAMTPQQAADAALAALDPTTAVSTADNVTVADRAAYELVLEPKTTTGEAQSLIGQVRIAIDAEQHIPLRVQVIADGAETPAFQVGFSKISFDTPGPEQFQFAPPPGATVTDSTTPQPAEGQADPQGPVVLDETPPARAGEAAGEPTVIGTGWSSIVLATLPADSALPDPAAGPTTVPSDEAPGQPGPSSTADADGTEQGTEQGIEQGAAPAAELQSVLGALPQVSGSWGSGRLLQSTLFSVLITDDGRVLGGAVAPEALYEAAAQ
jgi:outer membrane lipoprotein-sorting protein